MKLLITGGLGFIGGNFVRYIFNKHPDYTIINLDKITYCADPSSLEDIQASPRYHFIKADIAEPDEVSKVFEQFEPDYVVNCAAESHVDRSIRESEMFIRSNIKGVHTLLEASRLYNLKCFLQVSTDEVYGSIEHGFVSEEASLKPTSPYSSSKASGDLIALSYYHMFGLPIVISRSSNNYGPYQFPEKVIPIFITNAIENRKLPLHGDGSHRRNWLFVEDNCRAIDLILHEGQIGEIYNISSTFYDELSNRELAEIILKKLRKMKNLITFEEDRLGNDWRYGIDSTKIRNLGWEPEVTFEEGLARTIEWYRVNENWWKKRKSQAQVRRL